LRVLDENDNPPMFKELAYKIEIDQAVPLNTKLLQLEAFDADEGLNGALQYSIANKSPYFHIGNCCVLKVGLIGESINLPGKHC
jgi:hypothetical protein